MSVRNTPFRAAVLAALTSAFAGAAQAAPLYHLVNTGAEGGGLAINDAGAISGNGLVFGADDPIFRWEDGVTTPLQNDGNGGEAYAIDGADVVAGSMWTADDRTSAVYWNADGSAVHLGALAEGESSAAYGINDSGTIVGWSSLPGNEVGHSFIVRNGKMKDLDPKSESSTAQAINATGQITGGRMKPGSGQTHAFLYTGGKFKDLGTLGGNYSIGYAINAAGHVAGTSLMSPDHGNGRLYRAFLYKGHKMKNLGSLGGDSVARGVNDDDVVVGYSHVTHEHERWWVWSKGTMVDLSTALDGSSQGWTIDSVDGIDNAGQIVGRATPDGLHSYAVILDPVNQ